MCTFEIASQDGTREHSIDKMTHVTNENAANMMKFIKNVYQTRLLTILYLCIWVNCCFIYVVILEVVYATFYSVRGGRVLSDTKYFIWTNAVILKFIGPPRKIRMNEVDFSVFVLRSKDSRNGWSLRRIINKYWIR